MRRTSPRSTRRTNRCFPSMPPRAWTFSTPLPARSSKRPPQHSPNGRDSPAASPNCNVTSRTACAFSISGASRQSEIDDAKLQPGEDEHLETEKRVLANAEKIYTAAMNAFDLLYEGNASTSASLRAAQKHLEELARYEPKFQEALAALDSARISVEDVGASLRDYAGGIEASPEHLAEVEDRLALLDRLKRKYGPTLDDVIQLGRGSQPQALRDGEQRRSPTPVAGGAGASGRRISATRRAPSRRSAMKPHASWRSWSRPRSTTWP